MVVAKRDHTEWDNQDPEKWKWNVLPQLQFPALNLQAYVQFLPSSKKKKSFFAVYRNRYRKPEPIQMQRTKYHVVPHPNWYFYDTFPSPKNWDHCGGGSEKIMSQRNRKLAVREYLLEMLEKLHPWISLNIAWRSSEEECHQ